MEALSFTECFILKGTYSKAISAHFLTFISPLNDFIVIFLSDKLKLGFLFGGVVIRESR